jgi:hypothetical protein
MAFSVTTRMTRLAHHDFRGSPYLEPRRPSFARRIISRYQLVELTLIIGGILLIWGLFSLGRVHSTLTQAQGAWPVRAQIDGGS